MLISKQVTNEAGSLKDVWGANWQDIPTKRSAVESLISQMGDVREQVKKNLSDLD